MRETAKQPQWQFTVWAQMQRVLSVQLATFASPTVIGGLDPRSPGPHLTVMGMEHFLPVSRSCSPDPLRIKT